MDLRALGLSSNFSWVDWVIVAVYMAGTVAIGLYVKSYIADMADYIVAGRALKSSLAIATMIGTELGLVTVMYSAQVGFTGGLAALHIAVLAGVVTLIVGLTGVIVVRLRRMGVMTIPEFYERRFGRGVRVMGGVILAFAGILNMGMFLKAGAMFVSGLTGIYDNLAVNWIMTVLLLLVLAYTVLGGMVSVVITDYMQFVVLGAGLLLAAGMSVHAVGWQNMIDTVASVKGGAGFDPLDAKGFGWSYVLWMIFLGFCSCAVWQTAVMRACAAADEKVVKRLYCWSALGFLVRFMIPILLGVCALTYMAHTPKLNDYFVSIDALKKPVQTYRTLMALPVFLSQVLPAGVIGVIGAGMLAAFMSTHDSYLLCWASVLTQDVVAPCTDEQMSTRARLLLTRLFIVAIGAFLLIWGLWYPLGQNLWDYMAITGAIYFSGAVSLLVFGLYWRRASTTGAYLALACGALALLGLTPVQDALHLIFDVELVGLMTVALAAGMMIVGSLLFPDAPRAGEAKGASA